MICFETNCTVLANIIVKELLWSFKNLVILISLLPLWHLLTSQNFLSANSRFTVQKSRNKFTANNEENLYSKLYLEDDKPELIPWELAQKIQLATRLHGSEKCRTRTVKAKYWTKTFSEFVFWLWHFEHKKLGKNCIQLKRRKITFSSSLVLHN